MDDQPPLLGTFVCPDDETVRNPPTKTDYRHRIIGRMIEGGEVARRFLAENREVKWNPTGLPEMSMLHFRSIRNSSVREWKVAQEMEREGIIKIARGSWAEHDVYLIAGEKWAEFVEGKI